MRLCNIFQRTTVCYTNLEYYSGKELFDSWIRAVVVRFNQTNNKVSKFSFKVTDRIENTIKVYYFRRPVLSIRLSWRL